MMTLSFFTFSPAHQSSRRWDEASDVTRARVGCAHIYRVGDRHRCRQASEGWKLLVFIIVTYICLSIHSKPEAIIFFFQALSDFSKGD
jgi:hypothetical protein